MNRTALLQRVALALAIGAACAGASAALPPFTFNPAAATPALLGTPFTAQNILISDFSTVTLSGATFSETGFLSVSAFQLGGTTIIPTGLNSTYGLYVAFTGSGTASVGDPGTVPTVGTFTSFSYTLYGYNGTASFGFSGNTPTETATGEFALATGNLISGTVVTVPTGDGTTFTPSANAKLSFTGNPGQFGFFVSPVPFYDIALTAFTNTTSEVEPFDGGFRIRQGGGSINFAAPVPEPSAYVLMLAGLGVVGWAVRRRKALPQAA